MGPNSRGFVRVRAAFRVGLAPEGVLGWEGFRAAKTIRGGATVRVGRVFSFAQPSILTKYGKIYSMLMVLGGIALLAGLLAGWSFIVGKLLFRWIDRKIEDEKAELALHIRSFTESPGPDTPSPLALMADQFALLFAGRVWQQVEARMRGSNAQTTVELNKEEEAALAKRSPAAALAMAFLPKKIKKMLQTNPQMLGALSNLTAGAGQPGGGDHGNSGYTGRTHRD